MIYEMKILNDYREIIKYRREWNNIIVKDCESTIYQSFDWVYIYCTILLTTKLAYIILYVMNGSVVGIFPMQIRKFRGKSIFEFMGSCGTDYLMPLVCDENKNDIYMQFLSWVENQDTQSIFVFEDIKQEHSFSIFINNFELFKRKKIEKKATCQYYIISLENEWEAYKRKLSKRMQYEIEYDRRYLSKRIDYELREIGIDYIDEHIRLNIERMHSKNKKSAFENKTSYIFWKKFFKNQIYNNRLNIYAIIYNSEIISSIIYTDLKDKRMVLSLNTNIKYEKLSPGNVLLGYLIEDAINKNIKLIDLGRGYDSYKIRFGAEAHQNLRYYIGCKSINVGFSYINYLYSKLGYFLTEK